jgi:hypothetical protein
MIMLRKTLLILTAALGLTMSAQARLGWTMEDCEAQWGAAKSIVYAPKVGLNGYNFQAQANLSVQVYFLDERAQSVNYCSQNGRFLISSVSELLQKNFSGSWQLYDDGRGKQTLKSWRVADENGQVIAYALLWNKADNRGFYHLQVSTVAWGTFLDNHQSAQTLDSLNAAGSNGLNI